MSRNKKRKYWYTGYIVLGVIIAVSFAAGLFVGATVFTEPSVSTAQQTEQPEKQISTTEPIIIEDATYCNIPLSADLQDYIRSVCKEYSVPCELVYAMIEVESGYQQNIISSTGDYGLMQINKCNHEWLADELNITNILDPEQNILAGVYLISEHLKATDGDITLALMRYNCGATGASRLQEQGINSTSYTDKVVAVYERIIKEEKQDVR